MTRVHVRWGFMEEVGPDFTGPTIEVSDEEYRSYLEHLEACADWDYWLKVWAAQQEADPLPPVVIFNETLPEEGNSK